jgi:predicted metal-dependent hydrolase
MHQLDIPFELDEISLRKYFEKGSGKKIFLVITDNTSSMLSIRFGCKSVSLRLQRMFLSACPDVLNELVDYIKNSRRQTPLITKFINFNSHKLKGSKSRRINLQPVGKYHNLLDIYNSMNKKYFEGQVTASITWGPRARRRAAARRTLGSYSGYSNMIRINPVLDSSSVPKYFIEFIVYHEMLHADIGIKAGSTGRSIHAGEFKSREKLFKHYERALAWEKKKFY